MPFVPGSTYDPEHDPSVEQPKSKPAMLTPAYCVRPADEAACAATATAEVDAAGLLEAVLVAAIPLTMPIVRRLMVLTRRLFDGQERSSSLYRSRRFRGCLSRGATGARDALGVPVVLVLALETRHTCRRTSPAIATALGIRGGLRCDSRCHQGRVH